jgi:hypothetical protein
MKPAQITIIILLGLSLAACIGSTCPPDTVSYFSPPYPAEDLELVAQPQLVDIKGEEIMIDEVITGPVCNDSWSGTVYVTCDIQVPAWEKDAFFFQDCDLDIEESAVVYVEAHRDEPYYEGCSCHE